MSQMVIKSASAIVESCSLSDPSSQDGSESLSHGLAQKGDTDSDDKQLQLMLQNLPKRIREQLNSCPTKGNGVHDWLFKTALQLHRYFLEDEIIALLTENLSCERLEREIREAVVNSGKYARGEVGSPSQTSWPMVDYTMVHNIVVNSPIRLKDLSAISPVDLSTKEPRTEEILDALFPGNPLLCFGRSVNACWTKPRNFWRGRESDFQFIVANPMTKETGITTDGKESQRCLDNTGPRAFVVIEFDISESGNWAPYLRDWRNRGITTIDANVALIVELGTKGLPRLPLAIAVYSGGKSLHAWYPCAGLGDDQVKPLWRELLDLGPTRLLGLAVSWLGCQMAQGITESGSKYITSRQTFLA
jgi:hypothetical protein